jgi:putative tricarboxylic transport membrane protein
MERYDKFIGLFWLSLGLTIIFGGYKIGLGRLSNPGGGLFIFVLGMCLLLLAFVIFVSSYLRKIKDNKSVPSLWVGLKWKNPIYILIALIIYTLMITKLGYLLGTTLLLVFLFNVIERQKWKVVLFGAISATLLSYLVFGVWLQIRFPRGLFESLVGL